jgi:hypothetical protein
MSAWSPASPCAADVPLVMVIGMVAAGVTGSVALRRVRGTATPFGVLCRPGRRRRHAVVTFP